MIQLVNVDAKPVTRLEGDPVGAQLAWLRGRGIHQLATPGLRPISLCNADQDAAAAPVTDG